MKSISLNISLLALVTIGFLSCSKDKDAANQITDSVGLNIKTNWSLTDGSDAIASADLDVIVYRGTGAAKETTPVVEGSTGDSFEDEDFIGTLADGDYTVEIYYFEVLKPGKFNLIFKAKTSDKSYTFSDNSFTTSDDGMHVDFVKLSKSGTKYTVSKF
jgi:hypothetical protein